MSIERVRVRDSFADVSFFGMFKFMRQEKLLGGIFHGPSLVWISRRTLKEKFGIQKRLMASSEIDISFQIVELGQFQCLDAEIFEIVELTQFHMNQNSILSLGFYLELVQFHIDQNSILSLEFYMKPQSMLFSNPTLVQLQLVPLFSLVLALSTSSPPPPP